MKYKIKGGISALTFLEIVEEPVIKIIGLVQENQWFFGNPRLGNECMKIAADKLEEMIKSAQRSVQRTVEACPDNRHMYYIHFLNYEFCPYCGERLHSR